MQKKSLALLLAVAGSWPVIARASDAFRIPEIHRIAVIQAEGVQVYECRPGSAGVPSWQFKAPSATLFDRGVKIGKHYAGPTWEFVDGTIVKANVVAQAPGATPDDIPELILTVNTSSGGGAIAASKTIVRANTKGGVAGGACQLPGAMRSVPYSADYAFYDVARNN